MTKKLNLKSKPQNFIRSPKKCLVHTRTKKNANFILETQKFSNLCLKSLSSKSQTSMS